MKAYFGKEIGIKIGKERNKMEEAKKCACGMPLDEETTCKCDETKCAHCCECDVTCECGCKEKAVKNDGEGNCEHCEHHACCGGGDKEEKKEKDAE